MSIVSKPVVFESPETNEFKEDVKSFILHFASNEHEQVCLLDYPVIYIHTWKKKGCQQYDVYVGESNDIVARTGEHWHSAGNTKSWQKNMLKVNEPPVIYVVGHEHFNKSLTLDIENKLIQYIVSMGGHTVNEVHNGRGNPQGNYYTQTEFDTLFNDVWEALRNRNSSLFLPKAQVENFALFKASPMHTLTKAQSLIQTKIVERVKNAITNKLHGQLIFVEGEAGTGKTVLTSHAFYDLFCMKLEAGTRVNAYLMVNHDEQLNVFKDMAQTLDLKDSKRNVVVYKPTSFINKKFDDNVDVALVDEAHLLLTQGKQSYTGKNQLEDIIKKARVTVVMFDENQILTAQQYWEANAIKSFRDLAKSQGNYLELKDQMRMLAGQQTIQWIDSFTKKGKIEPIPYDDKYEVKIFDTPQMLQDAISKKASLQGSKLSRLIATYDWDYDLNKSPKNETNWCVRIGDWSLPWNRELLKTKTSQEKRMLKNRSWHEQNHTINEVGSTFTIQGFDLAYAGVILGPSVTYRNGEIVIDPSKSSNAKAVQKRTLSDESKVSFGKELIQHEVRVLMTRGVKGLYIYACDKELRNKLKESYKTKHVEKTHAKVTES